MKFKKAVAKGALLALTVLLMGGALFLFTYPWKKEPHYIIYIPKIVDNANEFWATLLAGANMAAKEYGANLSVMAGDSETDYRRQNELIEKAIDMKPDAIAVSPISYSENTQVLKKVKDAGIPLVYIDSVTDENVASAVISTDNVQMGRQLGEYMKNHLPAEPHIALMGHVEGSSTAIEREQGIRQGLGDFEDAVEEVLFCESSFQKAYTLTKDLLKQHPQINVISGMNEYSSTGVAQAVRDMGLSDRVAVFGIDSSTDQIEKLEEGVCRCIVIQNPFNMGYLGIEEAIRLADGETSQKLISVDSHLITKNNMYSEEKQKLLFPFIGKQATQDIVFE